MERSLMERHHALVGRGPLSVINLMRG